MTMPSTHPHAAEINRITKILQNAWARAEPLHPVTNYPVSYIATFVDMATAIVEDRLKGNSDAEGQREDGSDPCDRQV